MTADASSELLFGDWALASGNATTVIANQNIVAPESPPILRGLASRAESLATCNEIRFVCLISYPFILSRDCFCGIGTWIEFVRTRTESTACFA